MMKTWTIFILLFALSTSMAFADETGLTVEEAVKRMTEASVQLKLDALEIEARSLALEEAKLTAEGPIYAYDAASEYDKILKEVVDPMLAEAAYDRAVALMVEREASFFETIEALFKDIIRAEAEVKYLENALSLERAAYDRGKVDLTRGLISAIDLASMSYDLLKAEIDLEEAKLGLQMDYDTLKALVGWDETVEGDLEIHYPYTFESETDLITRDDEDVETWILEDATTAYLKVKYDSAQIAFDAADRLLYTYEKEWLAAKETLLASQKDYEAAVDALIVKRKNEINTYKMDKALYELAIFYADLMNQKVAQSEVLLSLGQISLETHLQTKLAAEKAQIFEW